MTFPTFLAFICSSTIPAPMLSAKKKIAEEFLGYDTSNWVSNTITSSRAGLMFWHQPMHSPVVPLFKMEPDRLLVSAYLPYGSSSVVSSVDIKSGAYISKLIDAIENNGLALARLCPPLVMVDCDLARGKIRIVNDLIGFGRVYEYRANGWTVWTNRLALAPVLIGDAPTASFEGWSSLASAGWFLGESTAYSGAKALPPATIANVDAVAGTFEYTRTMEVAPFLRGPETPKDETVEAICSDMLGVVKESYDFFPSAAVLGLSGGRDSRVIAALTLKVDDQILMETSYPPNLELEIAETLIKASPASLNWRSVRRGTDRMEESSDQPGAPLIEKSIAWNRYCDGDMMPTVLHRPGVPSFAPTQPRRRFSGIAGELGHANFYDPDPIKIKGLRINVPTAIQVAIYRERLINSPSVRIGSRSAARAMFNEIIAAAEADGIAGLTKLDYWYLFCRLRRWANGNWGIGAVTPFLCPSYIFAGIKMAPTDKKASLLHRKLIARLAPWWADIPFFHELKHKTPRREWTTGGAQPFLWEAGHEDQFISLLRSNTEIFRIYGRSLTKRYETVRSASPSSQMRSQRQAMRVLWQIGFTEHLRDVSRAAMQSALISGSS